MERGCPITNLRKLQQFCELHNIKVFFSGDWKKYFNNILVMQHYLKSNNFDCHLVVSQWVMYNFDVCVCLDFIIIQDMNELLWYDHHMIIIQP